MKSALAALKGPGTAWDFRLSLELPSGFRFPVSDDYEKAKGTANPALSPLLRRITPVMDTLAD